MGELKKMRIAPVDGSNSMNVLINPASIKRSKVINYDKKAVQGTVSTEPKFNSYENDTLEFELVFDGTGVIIPLQGEETKDISTDIDALNKAVYNYYGDKHEPNVVEISWGSTIFKGRLESLSFNYTLFKPEGSPLRAKASLKFVQYRTNEEAVKEAQNSSPDMTHLIEFKSGDNIQLMCNKVYGSGNYCIDVAKLNGLTSFRNISAGTSVLFSPLK
jgi:contractile injection system tube protein